MGESPLDRLVGAWEFEASVAGRSTGTGRVTFEWIEDDAFLLGRSVAEWIDPGWVENAPKTTRWVIGLDDTTHEVTHLYGDDRGVTRVYRGAVTDHRWHMERAAPGFHQRFVGEIRASGGRIDGRWETSPDGTAWKLDFPIVYRRNGTVA